MIMPLKHLYIIGNGFDRYHGAESGDSRVRGQVLK